MENVPEIPSALEVRLYDIELHGDNSFRLWLELEENRYAALDFLPGTEASERLLEVLTELATQAFTELGHRGVVITDFTPIATDDERQEDE